MEDEEALRRQLRELNKKYNDLRPFKRPEVQHQNRRKPLQNKEMYDPAKEEERKRKRFLSRQNESLNDVDKKRSKTETSRSPKKEVVKQRNRRMFGALMGHLGKARKEIEQDKDLLKKRDSVVSEVDKKDQEEIKKLLQKDVEKKWKEDEERDSIEMHRKITHLQLDLTRWIRNQRRDVEFITTKSLPPLLFAPAKHTEETEALIEAAKETLEEMIAKKRKETEIQVERLNQEFNDKKIARQEKRKEQDRKSIELQESADQESTAASGDPRDSSVDPSEQKTVSKEPADQESTTTTTAAAASGDQKASSEDPSEQKTELAEKDESKKTETSPSRKSRRGKLTAPAKESIDPRSLKVAELRKELKKRDCAVTGLKAELVQRLTDALASDSLKILHSSS